MATVSKKVSANPNERLHYRKSWLWLGIAVAVACGLMLFNQSQEASIQGLWFFQVSMSAALWLVWDQTIDRDYDTFKLIRSGNVAFAIYKLLTALFCISGALAVQG